jgi:two-component system NtrC family sensor kinase
MAKDEKRISEMFSNLEADIDSMKVSFDDAESVETESKHLEKILEASAAMTSNLNIDNLMENATDCVLKVMNAERGFLILADDDGELDFVVARTTDGSIIEDASREVSRGVIEKVIEKAEPVRTVDALHDERFDNRSSIKALELRSVLCVPLICKGVARGVLYVENRSFAGQFNQADLHYLSLLANQAAIALENARMYRTLEEAERQARAFAEKIVAESPIGIITISSEGVVTSMNPALIKMLGEGSEVSRGLNIRDIPGLWASHGDVLEEALGGRPARVERRAYTSVHGGRELLLTCQLTPMRNSEGDVEGVLLLVEDVTEKAQLEEQLIRSEKLSALGQLVSGVAHELNNPLSVITGYSQLLTRDVDDQNLRKKLTSISEEAQRCARIVKDLLDFGRQREPVKTFENLNTILEDSLRLRTYQLNVDNVEVTTNLDPHLPNTMVDKHQFAQVFINLINNAHQAMSHQTSPRKLSISSSASPSMISITFSDTGPGIPEEHLDKIFDPFFTTKEPGKGTGLGLSVSYGIVKSHGGQVTVSSRQDQGATFTVRVPIHQPPVIVERKPVAEESQGTGASGAKILLLEKDQSILEMMTDLLSSEGYEVVRVCDGTSAIEKIASNTFDLIFADASTPGVAGRDLYSFIIKTDPDLAERTIFTTGTEEEELAEELAELTGKPCLRKPYETDKALSLMRETMSS